MSGERTWLSEHRTTQGGGDAGRARATGSRFGHVWLEIAIFVLLVCTAGAIYFKGALVDRQFTIDHATAAKYIPYAYSDRSSGGHSSAAMVNASALSWACDIKPGYAYPFCGFGLELNQSGAATGIDLSGFAKVTLDITYSGPSERLKLALKNRDLVNGKPVEGMDAKPIGIEFPVKQGRQTIELDLAGATAEAWWVAAHKDAAPDARFDNVVAIDLQTGSISAAGPYTLSIHRIGFFGSAFTAEQWYLLILGVWIGFTALLLVGRLVMLKRTLAARQRRHLQEAQYLESARQAAESASQAKSRFLAHMSHELRTPLNAILGYAQILRSADLGERELRAARTIHDSGEHLLTLIGDILDHSKIAAGKHELQNASFDLREMIRTISEMVRGRAEEKGLGFAATIAPDVPRRVLGDQKALRQILINLLSNAVKFTRHGDVMLDVTVAAWQGGNVRLRFEVRDSGEGIPQDKQALIFQPFEQAGGSASNAGGTGLGLSISQQLAQLMGSNIELDSRPGEGSRFWLELSLPLGENALLPSEPAVEQAPSTPRAALDIPPPEALEPFLIPARTGNMRAIRTAAEALIAQSPDHREFGEHVIHLARNFQSAALLELIENNIGNRLAA